MNNWHALTTTDVIKKLITTDKGLSSQMAKKRLEKDGSNSLPEGKKFNGFKIFLRQFKDVLTYVLLIAAVISFFLHEITDMYVILAAVVVNVIVGYFQEAKAEKSLAMLKENIKQFSIVTRDGKQAEIESSDLVTGDLIICHPGDKIPADARIIKHHELTVTEAALTGESYPINKIIDALPSETVLGDRKNMLFTGTVVVKGRAEAIVCATGLDTEIGKIASLIKSTEDERTPLQNKLDKFAKSLGVIILVITFILFLLGVMQGREVKEMFLTAVAVAVSAIPGSLMVAVTAILAIGMQRILKKKALVRKLVAAETLGSITYICTDKTGTLTIGDMRVSKLITYNHDLNKVQLTSDLLEQHGERGPIKLLKIGVYGY